MVTLNIDQQDTTINAKVNDITVNVKIGAGVSSQTASYVEQDTEFYFDGSGGSSYLIYDSATSTLQLFANGNKKLQWS